MEESQSHPPFQAEKAQLHLENGTLEANQQKRGFTKPQSLHGSQQRFRQGRESNAAEKSTIALACGWIVEHQLSTNIW